MDSRTLAFYEGNSQRLSILYESADMRRFYESVNSLLQGEGKVLDVGCGEGRDVRALAQLGYEVVGCDASKAMIEIARSKAVGLNDLYLVRKFPVETNDALFQRSFDLVYSHAVIMHLPRNEREHMLCQLVQLVREGQYLILSWCNRAATDERVYELVEPSEIVQFLKDEGLSISSQYEEDDSLGRKIRWQNIVARKPSR